MTLTKPPTTSSITGKWKPYPAYEDSGVEWLGEIPEHWEVKRLKFTCQINPSKSDSSHFPIDMEVSFLPMELIGEDGTNSLKETRLIEQVRQGYTYFRDGDVIIAKITPCFENGKGALCNGLVNSIGFGTTELYVLRPKEENDPKFIFYLTKSEAFRKIGAAMMQGAAGQQRVPEEFVCNFQIGFPPLPEQRAISAFLDRETAKINTLIAKKERLIELLQEKRAALISHAVTKGLDPAVPMKDSGVGWLGEVPEHWEVKRLKFIADVLPGVTKGRDLGQRDVIELPYLRVANVQDGYLDLSDISTITVGIDEIDRYSLQIGDVLMNEGGDFDKLGRGYVWDGSITPCLHQNHVFAVRPHKGINPYWINVITLTSYAKHYFILKSKQSTNLASISGTNLKELPVLMPPDAECNAILEYIQYTTIKIDALISRIREGIEKLKEYSSALISAAVTGKIGVREETTISADGRARATARVAPTIHDGAW